MPIQGDLQGRVGLVLLQDTPSTAERSVLSSGTRASDLLLHVGASGWGLRDGVAGRRQDGLEAGHLLLKLIGQEQELAPCESPDIEFAEILELTVYLLLTEPRPPPDTEDEDGRSDTGIIWTRKILEDRENKRDFPPFLLTTYPLFKP